MTTSIPDPTGSGEAREPYVYYQDNWVTLWHGDCRDVPEWLGADLLVCDPPYGRGAYQHAWSDSRGGRRNPRKARDPITGDENTAVRDAIVATWGTKPAVVFGDLMLPPPAGTVHVGAYLKPQDAGKGGGTAGLRRDLEAVYFLGSWPRGDFGQESALFTTACRALSGIGGLAAKAGHRHAKPLDVITRLLRLAPDATCVADPTAGSGQILLAARHLGLRSIGVEIDEQHCANIAARLAKPDLFTEEAS